MMSVQDDQQRVGSPRGESRLATILSAGLVAVLWTCVLTLNLDLAAVRLLGAHGLEAPPLANRIAAMVLVYGPLPLAWVGYRLVRSKGLFVTVVLQLLLMGVALLFWFL